MNGEESVEVKEFKTKPKVFVISNGRSVGVTPDEHLKNMNKPLEQILREICEAAREYANAIYSKYEYPTGEWYPCGSADIALRWNTHRDIIKLFMAEGRHESNSWWNGWFGRLFKTRGEGCWWFPKLDCGSQSMRFEEEVCRFVRDKLALANIRVEVRTYID